MAAATDTLTPAQARARIKAHLVVKYHLRGGGPREKQERDEILLWGIRRATELGWYADGDHRGQVCWEGGPYEWAFGLTDDLFTGKLELPGYWLECATSFIVTLYPQEG